MKNTRVSIPPEWQSNLTPGVAIANGVRYPRSGNQTPHGISPRSGNHLINLNLIGGRYPQDRPHHRHGCVDNQQHPSAGDAARSLPGFAGRVTDAFRRVVPCPDSRRTSERIPAPLIGFASTSGYRNRSRSPLKSFVIKAIRNCFAGTSVSRQCQSCRKVLHARALSRPSTLLEGKTRARGTAPGTERLAKRSTSEMTGNAGIDRQKTRVWVGWGQNLLGTPIIDLILLHSAALSEIWAVLVRKSWFSGAVRLSKIRRRPVLKMLACHE
jgi:hypothetical protein